MYRRVFETILIQENDWDSIENILQSASVSASKDPNASAKAVRTTSAPGTKEFANLLRSCKILGKILQTVLVRHFVRS